jgi:hypothetical protein
MTEPSLTLIMNDPNLNNLQVANLINTSIDVAGKSESFKQLGLPLNPQQALDYSTKFSNQNIAPERELNEYINTIINTDFKIPTVSTFVGFLGTNQDLEDTDYSNLNDVKATLVTNLKLIQSTMIATPLNNYTQFINILQTTDGLKEEIYTDQLDPDQYATLFNQKGVKSETITSFVSDIYSYRSKMKSVDPNFKDPSGKTDDETNKMLRNLNSIADIMDTPKPANEMLSSTNDITNQNSRIFRYYFYRNSTGRWVRRNQRQLTRLKAKQAMSGQPPESFPEIPVAFDPENPTAVIPPAEPTPYESTFSQQSSFTETTPVEEIIQDGAVQQEQSSPVEIYPQFGIIDDISYGTTEIVKKISKNIYLDSIQCDDTCKAGMDQRLLKEGFNNVKEGFDNVKIPNTQLINEQVLEEQNLADRLHMMLYVWVVIAVFVFYVFMICILSENGWNPLANYVLIGILVFSFYYIYKNIV